MLPEALVDLLEVGDCWLWQGYIHPKGYGHYGRGAERRVHRIVWKTLVGPIPPDKEIDHLCRVRHCANPDHMEVVTKPTNVKRGYSPSTMARLQTVCPRCGGPYSFRWHTGRPSRYCRACNRLRRSDSAA